MKRLMERHRIAIYPILTGHPYDRFARVVGVHRVTVSKWMKDRLFLQALREKQTRLERQIEVELHGMSAVVGCVFRELLLFGSEGTKLQCVDFLFEIYIPELKKIAITESKEKEQMTKSCTWWKLSRI